VSFVHYVPDPTVVPCLGCNEIARERDLVKHGHHSGRSTFFWHPYHLWCLREAPPRPHAAATCADCGGELDVDQMRAAIRWGMTFERRLRQRMILATGEPIAYDDPDAAAPRPPGIRLVAVSRMVRRVPLVLEPRWVRVLDDVSEELEDHIRCQFELVHDACPDDHPLQWTTQLRSAPGDPDLREVYADWLEQHGELARAGLVRVVLARHRGTSDGSQLRALRSEFTGTWLRDVIGFL
jgi:uncharacterized protein (TIGR02996 family)